MTDVNPKTDPAPNENTVKDPNDWTTGDEPMTGAQASYLKNLEREDEHTLRDRPEQGRGLETHRRAARGSGAGVGAGRLANLKRRAVSAMIYREGASQLLSDVPRQSPVFEGSKNV